MISKELSKLNSMIISFLMSLITWFFVSKLLIYIPLIEFIIIEIIIAFGEVFSNFIKLKLGINKPKNPNKTL
jgi:hypothetical protein